VAVSARSSTSLSLRAGISTAVPLPRLLAALAAAEIAWRVQPAVRHNSCQGSAHNLWDSGESDGISGKSAHSLVRARRAYSGRRILVAMREHALRLSPEPTCSRAPPADHYADAIGVHVVLMMVLQHALSLPLRAAR